MEFYVDRYYDNEVTEEKRLEVTNDITERALSDDVFISQARHYLPKPLQLL